MTTITEVLQRQTGAIANMDTANANAKTMLANVSTTKQQYYNAKIDVRLASTEGRNALGQSRTFLREQPGGYDPQQEIALNNNNTLIQERRVESYNTIQQLDTKIGPDFSPVLNQPGVGGQGAITEGDDATALSPDFTPVRGETPGSTSSGAFVTNEALGRGENASQQTPYPSHLTDSQGETVTTGNADEISTYNPVLYEPTPGLEEITVVGGGLNPDDAAKTENSQFQTSAKGGVQTAKAFSEKFDASLNPTTEFAQLTYSIGLYLQTPEQYKQLLVSQKKTTQGLKKILQSGGNNVNDGALFPDLFIDNLELESLLPEANTSPHNVVRMSWNIIEPLGYTFLRKLKALCLANNMPSFSKQHYLMVIDFKGFDENGAELTSKDNGRLSKYIPFVFTKITTKVATGATEYNCQALATNHEVALSSKRATIPFNVELLGQSLNDLFNSTSDVINSPQRSTSQTTATSPWGTTEEIVTPGLLKNSAGNVQQSTGVINALNVQQKKLAKELGYTHADKYKVTFNGDIGKSKVTSDGAGLTVKRSKPMSASSQKQANAILNNTSYDKTRQIYAVPAGQQIHQFIDLMVRSSDYVSKQQTKRIDPKTGKVEDNPASNKFLQWYHVGVRVLPIAWDDKRGDYAYEIEYIVSPKQILETYSPYFPKAPFRGVHKDYKYWFTGENTEVLDYEQELNTTFYVAMDGRITQPKQDFGLDKENATSKGHVNMSGSAGIGQPGDSASPAEQAADVIYSTVDFIKFNMTILGDPDYIQQNDVLYTSGDTYAPFMPDGSINYDSQEVLVGLKFRTMEDYNAETGGADLQDPTFEGLDGPETGKLVYKLIRVRSNFTDGVMTQTMEGLLREFDKEQIADAQREEATQSPFVGPKRNGNSVPGQRAVTDSLMVAPNFSPISVRGNQVPGDRALTLGSSIGPDFTPVGAGSQVPGERALDTAGPIGPNFTPVDNGNSVPGGRAVTEDNTTAPNFLPIRGGFQGN